jgi:hypothetical protein
MTGPYLFGILGASVVLAWTFELVRRGRLREKYAAVWLAVSGTCLILAAFPTLLTIGTERLGFRLPVNLLFVAGAFVQLLVSMQLSIELGSRQSENRRLAEELALLEGRVSDLEKKQNVDSSRKMVVLG